MDDQQLEERATRATTALREAMAAAHKYNDFGSVLGAQDEVMEICETLIADLARAFVVRGG